MSATATRYPKSVRLWVHDLNHQETDPAKVEDDDSLARLRLRGVCYHANARGDAAVDITARLEGSVLADLRDRNLGQHREVREGRAAPIVKDGWLL